MLTVLTMIVVVQIPALFWFQGKKFLGAQTHPAALFILAWFSSSLLLSFTEEFSSHAGQISLLWVSINFGLFSIINACRKKPTAAEGAEVTKPEDPSST